MTKFDYVSLFSGIGGFETALNSLGGSCVLASDFDKYANQSYKALYGEETSGDVTKIDAAQVPHHDILVGGFPCQSFSVAGNRGGFEDARGTMFFEVARIAKRRKPKAIILENVKGLVSHDKGTTLDTIFKTLNDIGYTVDFEILNSKFYGVPQNRERIFIVALRDDLVNSEPWEIIGNKVIAKGKKRISGYDDVKTFNFNYPTNSEVTTRLRDILESEVDEKYYLSEEKTVALVEQLEKQLEKTPVVLHNIYGGFKESKPRVFESESPTIRTAAGGGHLPSVLEGKNIPQNINVIGHSGSGGQKGSIYSVDGVMSTLTATDYKQPKQIFDDADFNSNLEIRPVLTPDRIEKRQNGRRFKDNDEEAFTLTAQDRHGVAIREATKRGYTIAEEGGAVNFQFPDSKTRRGRVGKQIANTLEASNINQGVVVAGSLEHYQNDQINRVYDTEGQQGDYRIRKITPRECWRLQGFTDEQFNTVREAGLSDSQLYKQAGNAVTVNVVKAVAERLLTYL